jgi:hypothetical protein
VQCFTALPYFVIKDIFNEYNILVFSYSLRQIFGNQEWTIQKKLATLGAQDTGRIQAQQNTAQYVLDTTIC